ncbi:MAG TPA: hypothetical protein PKH54_02480 [Myxococcota bacterium]|nr:hypothetical protein [Myxococcota bacterium]HOC98782.1 hypothetical protein [Myxococcota bacterium]HOH77608.1 hypothetical protein [Myxococcota bacterium]
MKVTRRRRRINIVSRRQDRDCFQMEGQGMFPDGMTGIVSGLLPGGGFPMPRQVLSKDYGQRHAPSGGTFSFFDSGDQTLVKSGLLCDTNQHDD